MLLKSEDCIADIKKIPFSEGCLQIMAIFIGKINSCARGPSNYKISVEHGVGLMSDWPTQSPDVKVFQHKQIEVKWDWFRNVY